MRAAGAHERYLASLDAYELAVIWKYAGFPGAFPGARTARCVLSGPFPAEPGSAATPRPEMQGPGFERLAVALAVVRRVLLVPLRAPARLAPITRRRPRADVSPREHRARMSACPVNGPPARMTATGGAVPFTP
jgi:hypothetical protein